MILKYLSGYSLDVKMNMIFYVYWSWPFQIFVFSLSFSLSLCARVSTVRESNHYLMAFGTELQNIPLVWHSIKMMGEGGWFVVLLFTTKSVFIFIELFSFPQSTLSAQKTDELWRMCSWTGPWGFTRLSLQGFLGNCQMKLARLSGLRWRYSWYSFLSQAECGRKN